jgi:hypothetical protein
VRLLPEVILYKGNVCHAALNLINILSALLSKFDHGGITVPWGNVHLAFNLPGMNGSGSITCGFYCIIPNITSCPWIEMTIYAVSANSKQLARIETSMYI